jgi:hypothetical protein
MCTHFCTVVYLSANWKYFYLLMICINYYLLVYDFSLEVNIHSDKSKTETNENVETLNMF